MTAWANVTAIDERSRSAVLAFVPAEDVPFYSRTEVHIGSAIMLALCLIVVVALAVAWWRRR